MKLCRLQVQQSLSARTASLFRTIPPMLLALTLTAAIANAQVAATVSPSDWNEFHRENMQRWNPYESVVSVTNASRLAPKWSLVGRVFSPYEDPCNLLSYPFGNHPPSLPFNDQLSSTPSPSIANGVVYYGSVDGSLYAVNASTGARLWTAASACLESSPAVVNGVVYFGSSDNSLHALSARTGSQIWTYVTGGLVQSSPAVVNGVVYFGSDDGSLYALNAETGLKLWSFTTKGFTDSSPAVSDGIVYFGSSDGNVYALDARTGSKLWSYATSDQVESSPAVANGTVYIGNDGGTLYAIDAGTGVKRWSYTASPYGGITASPAVANGVVYVGSTNGTLYALDSMTGTLDWSNALDPLATSGGLDSSGAVANGVLYLGSGPGIDYALNASTGKVLWSYDITNTTFPPGSESNVSTSPAVANGVVYFINSYDNGDEGAVWDALYAFSLGADLYLRSTPSSAQVSQGSLLTYTFPVWNLGPENALHEVLSTEVPEGTTFDYLRVSGTPGLATCSHPRFGDIGPIVCRENSAMAPNTTWTVRLTVRVTAPRARHSGKVRS